MLKILIEELAEYAHDKAWSHWMKYLFENCGTLNQSGSFTIDAEKVERWTRQMNTPYSELPEDEKQSDRNQATYILDILHKSKAVKVVNGLQLLKDVGE